MTRVRFTQMYLVLFLTKSLLAQNSLEISRVDANPSELACSSEPDAAAVITAQVYFPNSDARLKDQTVLISFSIYSATPVGNVLLVPEPQQKVKLRESPGLATIRVKCNPHTVPGDITIVASIADAPKGLISQSKFGSPNSLVKIEIK